MTDKRDLKPASENPWYVLMTVAGEQTRDKIDVDLHARNRRYWNGWVAQAVSEDERAKLYKDRRITKADAQPLIDYERAEIANSLAERCGTNKIPELPVVLELWDTEFPEGLACGGFVFSTFTNFRGATFLGYAEFAGATFSGTAHFLGATFSGHAVFEGATFSGHAAFEDATFSGYAEFAGATFSGDAAFESATFSKYADFAGATFSRGANFEGATFSRGANFSNGAFELRTSFAGAKFLPPSANPPQFFNTKLHEDTEWTDVRWPDQPKTREEAIGHRRAYERLKLVMDSQNKFHDEHMFLRMELRCREIEEPNSWASWTSRLFRWTSDYGWSIRRPSAGLGITLASGWALIFIAEWFELWFGSDDYLGLGQSFALSLSNVFGFLGFSRTFLSDEIKTLTAFSEVVSATQTIVGLILFFLLGLALRNRFRIK